MSFACLKNFKNYQNSYLARLENLPYFNEYRVVIEEFLNKIVAKGAFYIRVRGDVLKKILQDGYLKNALQAGDSATNGKEGARVKSTELLFGCSSKELTKLDYPRFGYLSTDNVKANIFGTADMGYQYGDVVLKLKKENLFNRTTMTVGSSIDFLSSAYLIPTMVNDIKATCLFGIANNMDIAFKSPIGPGNLKAYKYLADRIKDGTINENNFYQIDELLGGENPLFKYFELQFHGDIKLSDIERIDYMDELDDETLALLENSKIEFEEQGF